MHALSLPRVLNHNRACRSYVFAGQFESRGKLRSGKAQLICSGIASKGLISDAHENKNCSRHSGYAVRNLFHGFDGVSPERIRPIRRFLRHASNPEREKDLQDKLVWIYTKQKEVLTSSVESGMSYFLFDEDGKQLSESWKEMARFTAVVETTDGCLCDSDGKELGKVVSVSSAEELKSLQKAASTVAGYLLVRFTCDSWQVIPAENLIAAFQNSGATLLTECLSADGARLMLEALELGVDGVVLRTDEPTEVRKLAKLLRERDRSAHRLALESATVTRVEPVGMGDRVCVDTCSMMSPGEGLLVGNFARALFLVHSECAESSYIASRPFRVNAGPVHAYAQGEDGKTAYLSELSSGSQVTIVDASGATRRAVVGRLKVEARPLVMVEAETADGQRHSAILQNAETVRLVGPGSGAGRGGEGAAWRAVSVSDMVPGDTVYVHRQDGARHTGIAIEEAIVER